MQPIINKLKKLHQKIKNQITKLQRHKKKVANLEIAYKKKNNLKKAPPNKNLQHSKRYLPKIKYKMIHKRK